MNKQPQTDDEVSALIPTNTMERSLRGGHWFLLDSILQKIIIFGTFFITARLLTPQDFGVIALASIYPALIDSLTAIGFDSALSQKKLGDEKPFLDVVWTFGLLRQCFVFLIVLFSAPFIASFFHTPDSLFLFQLSALPLLLQALSNIGQIYFFRHLELKKVFIRDMINYGTAGVVTLTAAYILHSYWALFIGNAVGILMAAISTYFLTSYRPHFDLTFSKMKPLLRYGEWVFGQGIIVRVAQTLEDTLVGHLTSAASVGFYTKSKSLSSAPLSPLSNIIGKIGFSALVIVQDSIVHVREGFYKSFDVSAFIAIPFAASIWIAGKKLVIILLGVSWAEIAPLLSILVAVAMLNVMIMNTATMMMNALNKPNFVFRINTVSLICILVFLPTLIITNGTYGAASALLISSIITNIYALFLIHKMISPDWERIFSSLAITIFSTIFPVVIAISFLRYNFSNENVSFSLLAFLVGLLYALLIFLFGKKFKIGPYNTILIIIQSFLTKIHAKDTNKL